MDRVCCFDDKGRAGCVVGLAAVSGEASGVEERHSRREARRESEQNTMNAKVAYTCFLFVFLPYCIKRTLYVYVCIDARVYAYIHTCMHLCKQTKPDISNTLS